VVTAFFQFAHNFIKRNNFIVKSYDQQILAFELIFSYAFDFFQDRTYPVFSPSGGTTGNCQLNNFFFSCCNAAEKGEQCQNQKYNKCFSHDPLHDSFLFYVNANPHLLQLQFTIDRYI
jgi:hypothetical protein